MRNHLGHLPGGEVEAIETEGAVRSGIHGHLPRGVDGDGIAPRLDFVAGEVPHWIGLFHRGIFTMRIDYEQGYPSLQELFQNHRGGIGFSRTGLGQDAAMLLHQGVGIQLHLYIISAQHADVHISPGQAERGLDQLLVGYEHRISRTGRAGGKMELAAVEHTNNPGFGYHHLSRIIISGRIGELVYAIGGIGALNVLYLG